jgi:O-antigen/teichoic acid export membrane protein
LTTPPIATPALSTFRSHVGNISRQSSVFLLGTAFTAVAGYFFKLYLARVLGAEALGMYALGMTVVGLAGVLAGFGLPQSTNRFVAVYAATGESEKLGRFLWSGLAVLLGANVVAGTAVLLLRFWIAGRVYHMPGLAPYLYFFVIIMTAGTLSGFLGQALAGYKDVAKRTIITSFVGQTVTIALTIALVTLGFGFKGYLAAQVVGAGGVMVLLGLAVWRLMPREARSAAIGVPAVEREILSFSMALFGVQIVEFCLGQADKIVLGVYVNAREVGIYSVALALVAFVPLALQAVNQIFSPTIAELHARGDVELLARLFRSLVKWTLGLTLPLATVMVLFAPSIMGIFGKEFISGWRVLAVGTLGQLVNCGVGSVGYLLLMSGHQRQLLRIQTIMAVVLVGTNLLLIPRIGLLGAAIASAGVTAVTNLWYLKEVGTSLDIRPSGVKYRDLLLPSAVMVALVVIFWRYANVSWPAWRVILAALAIAYAGMIGTWLFFLDNDDRAVTQAIWSKLLAAGGSARQPRI